MISRYIISINGSEYVGKLVNTKCFTKQDQKDPILQLFLRVSIISRLYFMVQVDPAGTQPGQMVEIELDLGLDGFETRASKIHKCPKQALIMLPVMKDPGLEKLGTERGLKQFLRALWGYRAGAQAFHASVPVALSAVGRPF